MRGDRITRSASVAFVLAVLGAFGLLNVRLFSFQPTGVLRVGILALGVGLVLALFVFARPPPELPEALGWFPHPLFRPSSREWCFASKWLSVRVQPGPSEDRRDAEVEWCYEVRNRSRRTIHELAIPLLAEVAVHASRMKLRLLEPAGAPPRVIGGSSLAPLVQVLLPLGGLSPNCVRRVRLAYRWPGFSDLAGDCYIVLLNDVERGGHAGVTVRFPADARISHGEAFVAGHRLGRWHRRQSLGTISPVQDAGTDLLEVSTSKRSRDGALLLYTIGLPRP